MDFEIDKAIAVMLRVLKDQGRCTRYAAILGKLYVVLSEVVVHNRAVQQAIEARKGRA